MILAYIYIDIASNQNAIQIPFGRVYIINIVIFSHHRYTYEPNYNNKYIPPLICVVVVVTGNNDCVGDGVATHLLYSFVLFSLLRLIFSTAMNDDGQQQIGDDLSRESIIISCSTILYNYVKSSCQSFLRSSFSALLLYLSLIFARVCTTFLPFGYFDLIFWKLKIESCRTTARTRDI